MGNIYETKMNEGVNDCGWSIDGESDCWIQTSCNNHLMKTLETLVNVDKYKYCPYCGRKIKLIK